jgi:putative membrane protein
MMWLYGPWNGFPWMWIFPLIFLVILLIFLFRGTGGPMCGGSGMHRRGPSGESTARDILDQRYARGEISADDYQRMKKDLEA